MAVERTARRATGSDDAPDIEALKREHARLDREKTTAEANLRNANEQLDLLKAEAREKYGTEDLEALKVKLKQMQDENERKRADYQKHLESINAELAAVEEKFKKG